jgi:hypothetical protein
MTRAESGRLYLQLVNHLRSELKKQGVILDTYDPDFLLGVVMSWLGEQGLALTEAGVRRVKGYGYSG